MTIMIMIMVMWSWRMEDRDRERVFEKERRGRDERRRRDEKEKRKKMANAIINDNNNNNRNNYQQQAASCKLKYGPWPESVLCALCSLNSVSAPDIINLPATELGTMVSVSLLWLFARSKSKITVGTTIAIITTIPIPKPGNLKTVNPACGARMWRKLLQLLVQVQLIRQHLNQDPSTQYAETCAVDPKWKTPRSI